MSSHRGDSLREGRGTRGDGVKDRGYRRCFKRFWGVCSFFCSFFRFGRKSVGGGV